MKSKVNEEEYIKEYLKDIPDSKLGIMFGVSGRTAERISSKLRNQGQVPNRKDLILDLPIERLKQQNRDLGRIDRKTLREYLRVENAVIGYHKELIKILNKHKLPKNTKKTKITVSKGVGIFHLTDLHFNELVDLEFNKYDFDIASKRLKKLVNRAKIYFKANKIRKVLIAMTGDLINSDRRLDELLSEATNRSNATFLAVSLLKQVILDLHQDYEISLVNVVGNESRVQEHLGWTDILASDNYDNTIYNILKYIFMDSNINFITGNAIEQVVEVNNQNVLFVHGNQFKSKLEQTTQKIKGKYSARNTNISFIISGHLHSCRLGETYARGGSLVGANGYSDSALQLESRASQNVHIFYGKGNWDSIKIDLQNVDGVIGYPIQKELEAYNAKSVNKAKKKTVISKIVI